MLTGIFMDSTNITEETIDDIQSVYNAHVNKDMVAKLIEVKKQVIPALILPEETTAVEPKVSKVKEELVATHGVFYTDGGCRPSRGIGGWGVHGYTFANEPAKQGTGCKNAVMTAEGYKLKADGAEAAKPDITIMQYVDGVGSLIPESTNNIAELMALLKTYRAIDKLNLTHATVILDSQYVRTGIENNLVTWEANDWVKGDGQIVANAEVWKQLAYEKQHLADKGVTMVYRWIKGHSGDVGNDLADKWATKGIMAGRNEITVDQVSYSPAKGYWNTKLDRNRMFSHPNWYFNTHRPEGGRVTSDGLYAYHLGDPRDDDELLGKRMVDATFSVLHLKEPDPVLENLRKVQESIDILKYGSIVVGRLNSILNKEVYQELASHGDRFVHRDYLHASLFTAEGQPLTKELRPPRLAFSAVDSLMMLESLMEEYFHPSAHSQIVGTDITALLYEVSTTDKKGLTKLKPSLTSATRSIEAEVGFRKDGSKAKITLTLSHDLPERNMLSAIAELTPKVTVVTWPESEQAFRFATIIEAGEDRGIWAGIYSNLHILKASQLLPKV
jgi:ribonuclease HI